MSTQESREWDAHNDRIADDQEANGIIEPEAPVSSPVPASEDGEALVEDLAHVLAIAFTENRDDTPFIRSRKQARAVLASDWFADRINRERAAALREAADEVRREARWQVEKQRSVSAISTLRAELVHGYAADRFGMVEQILRDRADREENR